MNRCDQMGSISIDGELSKEIFSASVMYGDCIGVGRREEKKWCCYGDIKSNHMIQFDDDELVRT